MRVWTRKSALIQLRTSLGKRLTEEWAPDAGTKLLGEPLHFVRLGMEINR